MKILITMAGTGSRFKKAGYDIEKHEIIFHGKTLFEWAIESLKNFKDSEFIFITRNFNYIEKFIYDKTRSVGLNKINVKIIDTITKGQAETALLAKEFFNDDDSLLIYNIDTYINPECLKLQMIKGDGWIPVFSSEGDKWSFVEADNDNLVIRTTEKVRISDNCSVGLYYFSSFLQYQSCTYKYYRDSGKPQESKEWYVAPLYNELINSGNKVYMHKLPKKEVIVLGTPEDLIIAEERLKDGDYC